MIREATKDDVKELLRLAWDFFEESMFNGTFTVRKCALHFFNLIDNHVFLVAERDNQIVGYITGFHVEYYFNDETEVQLNLFYVKPEYRGEGIASELLQSFTEKAAELGASRVFGANHSGVEQEAFRKIMEKHGFTKFSDYMVMNYG